MASNSKKALRSIASLLDSQTLVREMTKRVRKGEILMEFEVDEETGKEQIHITVEEKTRRTS